MKKNDGIYELPYATVQFRKDKVIHIHYKDHLFSLKENKTIFNLIKKKSKNRMNSLMVSGDGLLNHDIESKEFFAGQEITLYYSSIGFIVKNRTQKLAIKFFSRIYKPKIALNYFVNEQEALDWLYTFKKKQVKKNSVPAEKI